MVMYLYTAHVPIRFMAVYNSFLIGVQALFIIVVEIMCSSCIEAKENCTKMCLFHPEL